MIGPEPFGPGRHRTEAFDCGDAALNDWLRRRASQNMSGGGSVTWVVTDDSHRVIGYYAAATGSVGHHSASGRARRNQPDPLPSIVLGRLAVDRQHQAAGLGAALLKHFLTVVLEVAGRVGVRIVLVHAKGREARGFYERYGFVPSSVDEFVLHLLVEDLRRSLT